MNNASLPAPGIPHGLAVLTKKDAGRLAMRGLQALQLGLPTAAQQAAENFFSRHPDWFLFRVCRCGPIPQALIENYQDRWDWGRLSWNTALPWSEALIERYQDRWEWGKLSSNTALPWSEALIERYQERWDWRGRRRSLLDFFFLQGLSRNIALPWSEALIERYRDRWNWKGLSWNTALPWSEALIERYQDRWEWGELSSNTALPWSEALIERYQDRWDWGWLSSNTALPWSVTLIERYVHKWTFGRGLVSILLREPGCLSLTTQQTEKLTRQCLAAGRSADTVSAFAEICLTRRNINRLVSYCQALAAE
ncbi:hypothetical protein [Dentiradicibacter hellwigii]|uniref:Uncharacterized protein n=1 Tax=Dentiradicibacter hellwigii TaxID=3149053 RepID=A0ABV4UBP3_9RHOO